MLHPDTHARSSTPFVTQESGQTSWPKSPNLIAPVLTTPLACQPARHRSQRSRRRSSLQCSANTPTRSSSMHSSGSRMSRSSSLRSFNQMGADHRKGQQTPISAVDPYRARLEIGPRDCDCTIMKNPPPVSRHSSLRLTTKLWEEGGVAQDNGIQGGREGPRKQPPLHHVASEPNFTQTSPRPYSHPCGRRSTLASRSEPNESMVATPIFVPSTIPIEDPLKMASALPSRASTPTPSLPRPRATVSRLSSLDNVLSFRDEVAEWKRTSSIVGSRLSFIDADTRHDSSSVVGDSHLHANASAEETTDHTSSTSSTPASKSPASSQHTPPFRFRSAEWGFALTIMATQFLAEYLISGFALLLPRLTSGPDAIDAGSTGAFWPGVLLSLVLSATLLPFARFSDMYGGYPLFMFGVFWLCVWTLVPGFCFTDVVLLDVSRAMQGVAIAAFTPSTFAMIGSIYCEGPRKNVVMGLYASCAPLGFAGGFLIAGSLPDGMLAWYFWIAAIMAFMVLVAAYLSVPHDRTDRCALDLKMDWVGAFLITAGLLLLAYGLSVYPHVNRNDPHSQGFGDPMVLGPFISGLGCLFAAVWAEGWYVRCPLLPFDFFKPAGVVQFSLASLCFYGAYGVWLYTSAEIFQSPTGTTTSPNGRHGFDLALWYVPMAIGGLLLCIGGGAVMHIVPIMALLLTSGVAWIGCVLLLGLAPFPLQYWSFVFTSTICATVGLDLTYTISIIFLSAVQPLKYQGLAGAMSSILINLAMSFSLSVSEIVSSKAQSSLGPEASSDERINWGYKAALLYGAASAGLGFIICTLFVRMSRRVVQASSDEAGDDGEAQHRSNMSGVTGLRATMSSEASTLIVPSYIGNESKGMSATPSQSSIRQA